MAGVRTSLVATIVEVTSGTVRLVRSGFFRLRMASPSSAISTVAGINLGGGNHS